MLKSKTGGNIIGSGRNGRAWRAVTRVARSIGGNGEPVELAKVECLKSCMKETNLWVKGKDDELTTPICCN